MVIPRVPLPPSAAVPGQGNGAEAGCAVTSPAAILRHACASAVSVAPDIGAVTMLLGAYVLMYVVPIAEILIIYGHCTSRWW